MEKSGKEVGEPGDEPLQQRSRPCTRLWRRGHPPAQILLRLQVAEHRNLLAPHHLRYGTHKWPSPTRPVVVRPENRDRTPVVPQRNGIDIADVLILDPLLDPAGHLTR